MTRIPDIEKLREIALDQHGLITAAQADSIGVSRPSLSYLVKNKRIERVMRGIYRIPQIPSTPYDAFQQALLWAGDDSVLSHDTALAAWDVCDINPTVIHVTIPKAKRIQKSEQNNIQLHKEDLCKTSIRWWECMPLVSLKIALLQCIDRGVSSHILDQAIRNGISRGMLTKKDVVTLYRQMENRYGSHKQSLART